ncbi:MAG TPA: hypothetical protein VGB36_09295, partial [Gammaproteobacteria bacterium]
MQRLRRVRRAHQINTSAEDGARAFVVMKGLQCLFSALLSHETHLVEKLTLEGIAGKRQVVLRLVEPAPPFSRRVSHRASP